MKLKLLSIVIFVFNITASAYSQEFKIVYPKHIQYFKTNGEFFTNAVIVCKGDKTGLSIEFNGKQLVIQQMQTL